MVKLQKILNLNSGDINSHDDQITRLAAFQLVYSGLFSISQKSPYSLAQPSGSVKRVLFQD